VPGVPGWPGAGGVCGGEPVGRSSTRREQQRVHLAIGHHIPLAQARPELQQLFQKGSGPHGPSPLATQVHRHGPHVHR